MLFSGTIALNCPMNAFLIAVGDDDFSRVLPAELHRPGPETDKVNVKVMAFPPLGIQTLAPV